MSNVGKLTVGNISVKGYIHVYILVAVYIFPYA
jgi:hypothetical protein